MWSKQARRKILEKNKNMHNAKISKMLGFFWNSMSDEQKKPFKRESEKLRELHAIQFPNYKYKPKKKVLVHEACNASSPPQAATNSPTKGRKRGKVCKPAKGKITAKNKIPKTLFMQSRSSRGKSTARSMAVAHADTSNTTNADTDDDEAADVDAVMAETVNAQYARALTTQTSTDIKTEYSYDDSPELSPVSSQEENVSPISSPSSHNEPSSSLHLLDDLPGGIHLHVPSDFHRSSTYDLPTPMQYEESVYSGPCLLSTNDHFADDAPPSPADDSDLSDFLKTLSDPHLPDLFPLY